MGRRDSERPGLRAGVGRSMEITRFNWSTWRRDWLRHVGDWASGAECILAYYTHILTKKRAPRTNLIWINLSIRENSIIRTAIGRKCWGSYIDVDVGWAALRNAENLTTIP